LSIHLFVFTAKKIRHKETQRLFNFSTLLTDTLRLDLLINNAHL